MEQTAIQAGNLGSKTPAEAAVPPAAGTNGTTATATPESPRKNVHPLYQLLVRLADLRITVILFALALWLVFWGTLAQVDFGVWTIMQKYFRSLIVLVPLKVVFFNMVDETRIVLPYPGGWLIGGAMLINLLAAHAIRFKLTWSRSGILLIHAGLVVMMLGELVTGLFAVEGQMRIEEGQTANTVIDARTCELAIIHERDAKTDDEILVPAARLQTGSVIADDKVPFKIEVVQFMVNSKLLDKPKNRKATHGFGRVHLAEDVPEVSGVDNSQKIDTPSVYAKLTSLAGKDLGTWLFSTRLADPQWLTLDGKTYKLVLRFKQTTRDFTLKLTKFDHKVFDGTNTPKDYRSHIHLIDPTTKVDRNVEIYMNAPLYYRGETYYQSDMDRDDRGVITTTLQVVRNPGWLMPYVSCAVVGLGLLIHFGLTLYRFIDRRIVR